MSPRSNWSKIMKAQNAFTLIEIMVVVVILSILGALIIPNVINKPEEARVVKAKSDIRSIGTALEFYRLDNSTYPSTEQGLAALVSQPSGYPEAKKWNPEGYLPKLPIDPWGNPYVYLNKFEIYSYGADGKEGGDGYNADILYSELQ